MLRTLLRRRIATQVYGLFFLVALTVILSLVILPVGSVNASGTVSGVVYRDYNENGVQNVGEPGVGGVTITAYGASNTVVATASSIAPTGAYSISWGGGDPRVRLEFSGLPGTAQSGAFGSASGSSVQFVDAGASNVDFGINRPSDYSQPIANVDLVTTAFEFGDPTANSDFAVASYGYNQNSGSPTTVATLSQVGTVWGVAVQRPAGASPSIIYVSAFAKRQAGYGPGGPGAIYAIQGGSVITFATIPNAGSTAHDTADYRHDSNFYDAPGKESLGDMDISEDQQTLYVVNLNDRQLYSVDIATAAVTADGVIGTPTCTNGVYRPFGLGVRDGLVYVGGVCTGESDPLGDTSDLAAYVFSFNPTNNAVTQVLNFSLDYTRTCGDRDSTGGYKAGGVPVVCDVPISSQGGLGTMAHWQPWYNTWPRPQTLVVDGGSGTGDSGAFTYAEPMLSGIEFDGDDMIVGLRDRMGDQYGYQDPGPDISGSRFPSQTDDIASYITAGDLLRASPNGGGWTIENNGAGTDFGPSAGTGTGQGPGGGEYYYQDDRVLTGVVYHDETASGGIVQIPGQSTVAADMMDPTVLYTSGTRLFNNSDGTNVNDFDVRTTGPNDPPTTFFGKANGLGDLVALLDNPPIEIGNYVWSDTNNDGIQEPNETPLAGIQVQLVDSGGTVIGTAITAADGHYIFSSDTTRTSTTSEIYSLPIAFNTTYGVRVSMDTGTNASLAGLQPSPSVGGQGVRDSNGVLTSVSGTPYSVASVTTGFAGVNDHTIDFGFSTLAATATVTPPGTPSTPGTPGTPQSPTAVPGQPTIRKVADPPFAMPGDNVKWEIILNNPSSQTITNISFTDPVPSQLQITGTQVNPNQGTVTVNGQTVSYSVPSMSAGETITVTISTQVRSDTTVPFSITNVASLSGGGDGSATVLSVGTLPHTGEQPWWRIPLFISLTLIVVVGVFTSGFIVQHRRARS